MTSRIGKRIEASNRARIDALALDIGKGGIQAAVDYAKNAFNGTDEVASAFQTNAAIALITLSPNNTTPYTDYGINIALRRHCAQAILRGDQLSPELSRFAAKALIDGPPSKKTGRPSDPWHCLIACAVLRDLKDAGVPVYHGDGSNADTRFYAVDAVAEASGMYERTLRGWWQNREKIFGDI